MTLIVGGVGALVLIYCSAYFKTSAAGLGRFGGVFVAFAGAMLGLVTRRRPAAAVHVLGADDASSSYLLIGHYAERKASRRAAMQAIVITTRAGWRCSSASCCWRGGGHVPALGGHRDPPQGPPRSRSRSCCLLAGAVSKSALFPFHFWLPGGDGGADAGERVPARGGDGEGRRLPGRPVRPGVLDGPRRGAGSSSCSAAAPCCSAATGRCGSTTSSSSSRSARSASSA